MTAPLLYTRRAAADILGVSERTIDRLRDENLIIAVKVGTQIRITAKSVERYVRTLPRA